MQLTVIPIWCRQTVCFLPLEDVPQVATKILEFECKYRHVLKIPSWFIETFGCIFKICSGLCHPIQTFRILALILFISRSISNTDRKRTSRQFSCVIVPWYVELCHIKVGRISILILLLENCLLFLVSRLGKHHASLQWLSNNCSCQWSSFVSPGNNFPGIASRFAMHFLCNCYTKYLLCSSFLR